MIDELREALRGEVGDAVDDWINDADHSVDLFDFIADHLAPKLDRARRQEHIRGQDHARLDAEEQDLEAADAPLPTLDIDNPEHFAAAIREGKRK